MANANEPINSLNLIYDKYASFLFGYILSILKDEPQAIEILSKTLLLLNDKINNKQAIENVFLEGIRIANRAILEITNLERQFLLEIFKKFDT
ncbi:MAG: hypothetical protein ABI185_02315 [Ginsengibacter sp.]